MGIAVKRLSFVWALAPVICSLVWTGASAQTANKNWLDHDSIDTNIDAGAVCG
jgi:hypothetical protein